MMEKMMKETTVKLLEEIDLGCRMAKNSFAQIAQYEKSEDLAKLLDQYDRKHKEIQKEAGKLLLRYGGQEKKPHPVTEAMSWITTQVRMLGKENDAQIAKLMMNGCNMGIQSIGKKQNDLPKAAKEALDLSERLIKTEESFMEEMKPFL